MTDFDRGTARPYDGPVEPGDGHETSHRAGVLTALRRRHAGWIAPGDGTTMLVGGGIASLLLAGFWLLATRESPDVWVPVLVMMVALMVSIPICLRLSGRPFDKKLRWILVLGLLLKLASPFARYYVNEKTYGGEADSGQYDLAGKTFVENVHQGRWSIEGADIDGLSDETRAVGYITGLLYLVVGPTYFGGFIVFSWVCWIGLVFFFKAFRIAYPNAPPYLAGILIFFLPSLVYWPSSIGKDALMVFALGLLTWGMAKVFVGRHRLVGIVAVVPAALLCLTIRPHVLLVAVVGVAASLVARNASDRPTFGSAMTRVLVLVLLVPMLILGMSRLDRFFGTTDGGLQQALDRTETQTSIGGSSFETRPVTNPVDFPVAIVSVIYRPFLFEASGAALVSALEGSVLLALTVMGARWIWRVGPAMYRNQFAAFCGGYVLAFVFAFSNIGNAGILARQRVQMFPFLILLVAAAKEHERVHLESSRTIEPSDGPLPTPSHEKVPTAL